MMKVLWGIYNLLLPLALLLAAPSYVIRMRKRGQAAYRWKERFGIFDAVVQKQLEQTKEAVWIHAVSVGEVKMAEVMIRELRRMRPEQDVVLSTTTITGRRLAESIGDDRLTVIFHTLDLWWCVKRGFDRINPALVVLVEQELWPNQLWLSQQRGIPVWLVNARLSDRSRRRFSKFQSVLRPLLGMLNFVGVQSQQEIERLGACGFPPHKLFNVGSMKFDVVPESDESRQAELRQLLAQLGWGAEDLVILCGSTHAPEEEMLLKQCRQLDTAGQTVRVILVPRHAERVHEIKKVCEDAHLACVLRSEIADHGGSFVPEVLLVDTTGELSSLYGVADINIIGKSFYGVGGQNFLEAARFPHPIVVGPEMSNFKDTVTLFKNQGALIQVEDEHELLRVLLGLVTDAALRIETGQKACRVMVANRGAAKRQAEMLVQYLESDHMQAC
ncbi:MAG: glycosyltransferase N-terminal domain-containing protein [Verrucomicrobiota bacterium]